ncbi:hypothetical protein [Sphingorhabdus pulchriflava]|nr:hypothetical protein [Sphingorhabdus pulchriflava]
MVGGRFLIVAMATATYFGAPYAPAQAATKNVKVCGLYSTVELESGEIAEATGAGANSVSMTITGPKGTWWFYESKGTAKIEPADTQVYADKTKKIYRRGHNALIYMVVPTNASTPIIASAFGQDFAGNLPEKRAILGTAQDVQVARRIIPGVMKKCDKRWMPGQGLK